MTIGNKLRLGGAILLFVTVLTPAAAAEAPGHSTLISILSGFSKIDESTVGFDEQKLLSTHKQPVKLSGSLVYRKPGYLKKHIDRPYEEMLEINGDYLSVTDYEGFTQQISLQDTPEVYLYVYAFRGMLSGNYQLLNENFRIDFKGKAEDWVIGFVPLVKSDKQILKQIIFAGRHAKISRIEIINRDDKSTLRLHDRKN